MPDRWVQYLPGLIAVGCVGSYLGKRILVHVFQVLFQRIVLGVVFAIGLVTLISAVS